MHTSLPLVASQCSTCTSSWLESLHWLSSSSHNQAKAGLRALKTNQDGLAGQFCPYEDKGSHLLCKTAPSLHLNLSCAPFICNLGVGSLSGRCGTDLNKD